MNRSGKWQGASSRTRECGNESQAWAPHVRCSSWLAIASLGAPAPNHRASPTNLKWNLTIETPRRLAQPRIVSTIHDTRETNPHRRCTTVMLGRKEALRGDLARPTTRPTVSREK